jgi:hypothetical protein
MLSPRARCIAGILLAALLVPIAVPTVRELPFPGPAPGAVALPTAPPGARTAVLALNVSVVLSPGTWTMSPGDGVNLSASLIGVPEDCLFEFDWFDWVLDAASLTEGYLNASSGPTIRVTADAGARTPFLVSVLATTGLLCVGEPTTVQTSASTLIELRPPLSIPSVTLSPDPAVPGELVALRWDVTGGMGPYSVDIDFGDGTNATAFQQAPGAGAIFHRFPAGEFAPEIAVVDAGGNRVVATDPTPMVSDSSLAVSVAAASDGPEVGRPFLDNGTIVGGVGVVQFSWSVNGTIVATGESPEVPMLQFTPTEPGPISVRLFAQDAFRENGSATQNLTVAPVPSFAITAVSPGGDLGRPFLLNLTVSGGLAPYSLDWSVLPNATSGSLTLPTGGTHLVPVVPSSAGPLVLQATLTDAVGASSSDTFDVGEIGVDPSASLLVPSGPVEAGEPVQIDLEIVGGSGPFDWSIEPSEGVDAATPSTGVASRGSPVQWTGTPTASGPLEVTAFIVDAVGGFAETNRSIPVLGALVLSDIVTNGSAAGATVLTVYEDVGGGLPPYSLNANVGGLSAGLANVTAPGGYTLRIDGPPAGYDDLRVEVTDSAGANLSRSQMVFVSPVLAGPVAPSPAAPIASSASLGLSGTAAGVGLLLAGLAGGFWWLRRRATGGALPAAASESGRALGLVRRSLSNGEGMDPESLAILGAEDGLAGPAVDAAIRQWERLGRIRRETDPTGGDLILWNPTRGAAGPEAADGGGA